MKKISKLLIAAIVAIGVSSCGDPLDIFDEFDTSNTTTESTDSGVSYSGLTTVMLGDSTTFSSYNVSVEIEEESSSEVTLTMCDILFTDVSPAFELVMSKIEGSSTTGKYAEDSVTPTTVSGMVHEDVTLTNIAISISSNSISISFSATYEGETYSVTYSGEVDS